MGLLMMRLMGVFLLLLPLLTQAQRSLAQGRGQSTGRTGLEEKLDAILAKQPFDTQLGMVIQAVDTGQVFYAKNSETLLIPASVTKIATSLAVLHEFGPNYQFATPLLFVGKRQGSTIQGDLLIRGTGDPLLTSELLWIAAADLKHLGVKTITGKLLIDNSLFLDEPLDRIEGETDSSYAYDAPITAFGVNFNSFEIAIASDSAAKFAHVGLYPYAISGLTIDNKVAQARGGQAASLSLSRLSPSQDGGREKIIASGRINEGRGLLKMHRSVFDPVWASGEQVKSFFAAEGIIIKGAVAGMPKGKDMLAAEPLMEIQGYPLHKIIQGLNHFSNNYIADVLTKDLGVAYAKSRNQPLSGSGNFRDGVRYLEGFLGSEVGIKDKFVLKNGSGLSQENRFSVKQVNAMLIYGYRNMQIMPEFVASLANAGETGTLKKRFSDEGTRSAKGLVRGKTGTLSNPVAVAALAGYFMSKDHGMIAFAILENGSRKAAVAIAALRKRQDLLVATALNNL